MPPLMQLRWRGSRSLGTCCLTHVRGHVLTDLKVSEQSGSGKQINNRTPSSAAMQAVIPFGAVCLRNTINVAGVLYPSNCSAKKIYVISVNNIISSKVICWIKNSLRLVKLLRNTLGIRIFKSLTVVQLNVW